MSENLKWIVYCHTNKINGKKYIGITSQKIDRRWRKGDGYKKQSVFGRAINKYGWDNFDHEIIEDNICTLEIDEKEQYYIELYNTVLPNGYNVTKGGRECKYSTEYKKKLSKSKKGIIPKNIDSLHTPEIALKISESLKGRKNYTTAKEVECDGIIYQSLTDLAGSIGVKSGTIFSWIERKRLPKEYYKKKLKLVNEDFSLYSIQAGRGGSGKDSSVAKTVICLTTGQIFDTIKQAADYYKIKSSMSIIYCCKNRRKHGGKLPDGTKLEWAYYEDYLKGGEKDIGENL